MFNKKLKEECESLRHDLTLAISGVRMVNDKLKKTEADIERLERIIKYARDDRPTWRFDVEFVPHTYEPYVKRTLYLYIDKQEYLVGTFTGSRLKYISDNRKDVKLTVDNGLAYLTLDTIVAYHELIIDYRNGTFIEKFNMKTCEDVNKEEVVTNE